MRTLINMKWRATAVAVALLGAGLAVTLGRPPAARAGDSFAVAREVEVQDRAVGEVRVNDVVVIRLRNSQEKSGAELAEDVARRLNNLHGRKSLRASDLSVRPAGDVALLQAGAEVLLVVDADQTRGSNTTPLALARSWRENLVRALDPQSRDTGSARGGTPARRLDADSRQRPEEESRTKIVPILTVGSSLRVGVAQVIGPVSRVDEVKAVARLDTDYKDAVRIAVLVPISTENVVSNIKRVPQVSISAVGDLKL